MSGQGGPRLRAPLAPALRPWLVAAAVAVTMLTGEAAHVATAQAQAQATDVPVRPWSDLVWYEIFVRSFQDSDGDGIGDLQGVRSRLPYLAELGVGGIWLMPIHPSPSYHGYDITDYRAVNPDYGDLDDLRALLDDAHALGMRVIFDYVPNHTSAQHPWFQAALAGDPAYRDTYVWSDDPPDWRGTGGGSAWHQVDGGSEGTAPGRAYLGLFSASMPDLNHRNPEVRRELFDVARFWLEFGFDGMRVDAIQHIIEGEDGSIRNTDATYAWVAEFEAFVHRVRSGAFVLGETWTETPAIVRYHAEADLDMSLDYPLWRVTLAAIQARSAADLAFQLEQTQAQYPEDAVRGVFLSNHDQTRHATQLSFPRRDERRLKLAAALLLTMPGTPILYYGEEIGMPDGPGAFDVEKRTPMRWEAPAADGTFGFSTAAPWTAPGDAVAGVSVAEQRDDPASLWTTYQRLIALRAAHPALRHGATDVVDVGERAVLALHRTVGEDDVLVLANLAGRTVTVSLASVAWEAARDLLDEGAATIAAGAGASVELSGYEVRLLAPAGER